MPAFSPGVYLYWIPLGAGGVGYIRLNGRIYETLKAMSERRPPLDLYHTALRVVTAEATYVIENAWPSPNSDTASRGVVLEGPVFGRPLGRFRPLRYEVRRWQDGTIPDADSAAGEPQLVSDDSALAHRVLQLVDQLPAMIWGRDQIDAGEMWNSNSVIAWLLAKAGTDLRLVVPPANGRAPGWQAGLKLARTAWKEGRA